MLGRICKGKIAYVNCNKQFFFVRCNTLEISTDVFVHFNEVSNPSKIQLGRMIEFRLGESRKGYLGLTATVLEDE